MKTNTYLTNDNRKLTYIDTYNGNEIIKEENLATQETKYIVCKGYIGTPPKGTFAYCYEFDTLNEATKEAEKYEDSEEATKLMEFIKKIHHKKEYHMPNNMSFNNNRLLTHLKTIKGNVIIKEEEYNWDFNWAETKYLVCKGYEGTPPKGFYIYANSYETLEEAIKDAETNPNRM